MTLCISFRWFQVKSPIDFVREKRDLIPMLRNGHIKVAKEAVEYTAADQFLVSYSFFLGFSAFFEGMGNPHLSIERVFYRTRVRSLAMLVTH